MEFKQYPSYKNSGVEWLGDVPDDWTIKRFSHIFIENKKKNTGLKETNVLSLSYGSIKEKNIDDNKGLLPESFETYQIIEPNDIVFRFTDLQNDKRSLRSAISKFHGIITSAYIGVKTKENADFYNYLFRAYDLQKVFYSMGEGMRQSLKMDELNKMPIVVPKPSDQQKIVSFLDTETARIDKLISKQEKLIKLLEEQRKSIISYAVTKGLNPNAPMKDSGVEWLGDVPEGWTMLKLNFVVNQIADIDHYMPNSSSQGFPYLMTGDLQEKVSLIDFLKCKQVSTEDYLHLSKKIKSSKGDLILARYATIGTVSYVDIDANFLVSYSCVTIKPKLSKIIGMYLYYYIKSNAFYNFCKNYINTNTQGNLGIDNLKKINVLLPSIFEQENIINFLDSENIKFDNLISKQEKLIEKLKEYRSSIISHAVTGKIDVREWVA